MELLEARIRDTETLLQTLGTVEDFSNDTLESYKTKIPKTYALYENKYNDSVDDSLCIELYTEGTYLITNDDLPYSCYSKNDRQLLEELFYETPFELEINEHKGETYAASISVSAWAKNIYEVKGLILQFRSCNDGFLANKVQEKVGDDGHIYLDRLTD